MAAEEVASLPETAFAWPEERRFPVHSPEHAALSYVYAKEAAETPRDALQRIQQALDVYQVPQDIFQEVKVASEESPDDWLCPDLKLFPVRTAAEFSRAQRDFVESYPKLDMAHRRMASLALYKQASQRKVALDPLVQKTAGQTVSHLPTMSAWLKARASATKVPEVRAAFDKLAAEIAVFGEESKDLQALTKFATAIEQLDELGGLVRFYDRKLPDPQLTVFNTSKLAAESMDIAGAMIPLSKLAALPSSFWEDLGGRELADEIAPGGRVDAQKMATVVETLPMDLKTILRSQLRG